MKKPKSVSMLVEKSLQDYQEAFLTTAKEILGEGYVDDYYEIVTSELRWAFKEGFRVGRMSKRGKK